MIVIDSNPEAASPLMVALSFGEEALRANQNGYLTKQQRGYLNRQREFWRTLSWIIAVIIPIAIVLAVWDGIRIGDTVSSRVGIVIYILFITGALLVYTNLKRRPFEQDLAKGDVASIEGVIRLESYLARNGMRYFAYIDKTNFNVNRHLFNALKSDQSYKVYYAPFSKSILSAEPIE